jgi:predicted nucleic acid-binding protein
MSGIEYLLDTNVVIDLLTDTEQTTSFFRETVPHNAVFFISQITRMELLSLPGVLLNAEQRIRRFINDTIVLTIDDRVEEQAIQLRRKQRLKLPDAIITSTAIVKGAVFLTSDKRLIESMPPGFQVIDPRGWKKPL